MFKLTRNGKKICLVRYSGMAMEETLLKDFSSSGFMKKKNITHSN